MTVFPKHSRVVSFRVPEGEYEALRRISEEKGAHSVSDYARWIVRHGIEDGDICEPSSLPDQVRSLSTRMEELAREVMRLKSLLGAI